MIELLNVETPQVQTPTKEYKRVELNEDHQRVIDYTVSHKLGEYDDKTQRLSVDTVALKEAHEALELRGRFETNSTGKNYPNDRNSHAYPVVGGAWKVYRHGEVTEADTWEVNENGHTWCWLNKAPRKKGSDPADSIVEDALRIDKFFNWEGIAYVQVIRKNKIENLMVGSEAYERLVRCRYRNTYHRVPKAEWIKNAISQLIAMAIDESDEIPIYVRIAYYDGKLYIDLADREGNIVEIDTIGYRVIQVAPVKFVRTDYMLSLPKAEAGGSWELLKPFVNIEDDDFPLLVGAILGCYLTSGTLPFIPIKGGDGRCKTSTALRIVDLVDPSLIKGCSPPKNEEDLILSARKRWVYFIDNLQELKSWLADAFCRTCSGNASERRTLFKNSDTSAFIVKRPVIITSIKNVIEPHPDLTARSVPFDLPRVATYKTEAILEAEFKKVRPKILGAIYKSISCALRNISEIKDIKISRLADFCVWIQAAEKDTGLEKGSIIKAYETAREALIAQTLSSELADKIIELGKPFDGTGKELSIKLGFNFTKDSEVRSMLNDIRKIQTSLEYKNIFIKFNSKSHGKSTIEITGVK